MFEVKYDQENTLNAGIIVQIDMLIEQETIPEFIRKLQEHDII